jgi:thiamine biosynthesis lipoprotein
MIATHAGAVALPATVRHRGGSEMLCFEARAMGSPLRLSVVVHDCRAEALDLSANAWLAVRSEFEASEEAMSRFRDSSEVTRLNRTAGRLEGIAVSWRLRQALTVSDRAHRLTEGRFEPRVLRDLERLGDAGADLDSSRGVSDGRPAGPIAEVDGTRRFRLDQPVDLGGIGKGLALRWAGAVLDRVGIESFLLDAGGDLLVRGEPREGGPWRIGIEDPTGGPEPLAVLTADNGAVTTSSVRRRRWTAGSRTVHHLIDPFTGEPGGSGLLAVTVAAPDPAWSEIWSKALFLAGRAGIAGLARRHDLAAWWIGDDGSLEMTAAARQRTLWVATGAIGAGRT